MSHAHRLLPVLLVACAPGACEPPRAAPHAPAPVVEPALEGAVEFDLGPPDVPRALLVAVHGRGDRPERFAAVFRSLEVPVHVRVLRAPLPVGDGYAWFPLGGARWGDDFGASTQRVIHGLAPRRGEHFCGRPVLVGFSQGAMLAYAVATVAPTATAAVFPLAGELPERLRASARAPAPGETFTRVFAEHGDADPVIPYGHGLDAVNFLRDHGYDVRLDTEPGEAHTLAPAARAQLARDLADVLRAQCR